MVRKRFGQRHPPDRALLGAAGFFFAQCLALSVAGCGFDFAGLFAGCPASRGDCDPSARERCATDLSSDRGNCGACGVSCDGACHEGICVGTGGAGDSGTTGATTGSGGEGAAAPCQSPEGSPPAWVTSFQPVEEVFVSPNGSDGNTGASLEDALKTTAAALARLAPGVRLNFARGTYGCPVDIANFAGSTESPGVIRSVEGVATFDCGGGSGFRLEHVRGLVIDGIEIENTEGPGIHFPPGVGPFDENDLTGDVVIMRSNIHDTGGSAIAAWQSERLTVLGNVLSDIPVTSDFVHLSAVDDAVIARNEAHHGGPFDTIGGGSRRGRIYGNFIHDTRGGIGLGADCTSTVELVHADADAEASDLRVWDNRVVNDDVQLFRIVSCKGCVASNNTYWTNAPGRMVHYVDGGFSSLPDQCPEATLPNEDVVLQNNAFASTSPPSALMITANNTGTTLTMKNNAWWVGQGINVRDQPSDFAIDGDLDSLYSVDPGFVDPPEDLTPGPESALRQKGLATEWVVGNANGECWTAAPNIGAY